MIRFDDEQSWWLVKGHTIGCNDPVAVIVWDSKHSGVHDESPVTNVPKLLDRVTIDWVQ